MKLHLTTETESQVGHNHSSPSSKNSTASFCEMPKFKNHCHKRLQSRAGRLIREAYGTFIIWVSATV